MKRLLTLFFTSLVLTTSLLTFTTTASATTQDDVKAYLDAYRDMLVFIRNNPGTETTSYLKSGKYNELVGWNGGQLDAAIDVLRLVVRGDFDSCCWVGNTPGVYDNFPGVSYSQTQSTSYFTYFTYLDINGTGRYWWVPSSVRKDMHAIDRLLTVVKNLNNQYGSGTGQSMKRHEMILMQKLEPIWRKIKWGFSYVDDTRYPDSRLTKEFRDRYAFSCILCYGAGFYDTSRLHTVSNHNRYPNNDYYDIFDELSISTQSFLLSMSDFQYPKNIDWNGYAPIQLSTGPTFQGSPESLYDNDSDRKRMYQTHCHGATELYKTLDPMQVIAEVGEPHEWNEAVGYLPYTPTSPADFTTYTSNHDEGLFLADMYVTWLTYNSNNAFKENPVGSMFYNDELDYHALHNGKWMQLTQWSRLTSPAEGTYFPLHNQTGQVMYTLNTSFPLHTTANPPNPDGKNCKKL